MTLTYSSYLELDKVLDCQHPRSEPAEHDELLFIVIHQAYELWFKQLLHEADHLAGLLAAGELARGGRTLGRMRTIMKLLVAQMDVLETMTPFEFASFRDRLGTASGFQSAQFREFEFAMGHKQPHLMNPFEAGSAQRQRLERRFSAPTLWDAMLGLIARRGHLVPAGVPARDVTAAVEPSPELQRVLIGIYRDDPELAGFCEQLTDFDEGVQEWRYRHVKMVERTIGAKPGTGGSSGVEYLKSTLHRPFFPDLWAFRSEVG